MTKQKQPGLLRLRSHQVSFGAALFLALVVSLIPANVVREQTPKRGELVGEWQWSSVGNSGRLRIATQSDGKFSGALDPAANDPRANDPRIGGPQFTGIEGQIQGDR